VAAYSVTPGLAGLSLSTPTGVISETPTAVALGREYTSRRHTLRLPALRLKLEGGPSRNPR
jgi:hypothetical protein